MILGLTKILIQTNYNKKLHCNKKTIKNKLCGDTVLPYFMRYR